MEELLKKKKKKKPYEYNITGFQEAKREKPSAT